MEGFDLIALWVGRVMIWAGGAVLVTLTLMLALNLVWRKWGDMAAFIGVMHEARRQGRRIFGPGRYNKRGDVYVHDPPAAQESGDA